MQSTAPKQRDRHGSARKTKALSWRVIMRMMSDFDTATDTGERLKIGRLLCNAFSGHAKLVEVADFDERLKAIERQLGESL